MKPRTKLFIVLAAVSTVAIIGLLIFLSSRQKALLTVTSSDSQATITVNTLATGQAVNGTKGVEGRFSQKVPVGDYVVTARNNASSVKQTITVKAGPEIKINLAFASILPLEMVAALPAANFIDNGRDFQFIHLDANTLTHINQQNQISMIKNYNFRNIKWADTTFGAGLASTGKFYLIKNLVPEILDVPFSSTNNSSLVIAPNQDIYVSNGTIVYRYHEGKFTKIFETKHSVNVMAASNDAVIVLEGGESKTGAKADEGYIVRINLNGQTKKVEGESYDSEWSPDGSKFIINGDEGTTVLSKDLKKLIQLPQSNVNSPVWLDDNTLAFSIGSGLWRFDVSTGLSQQIASNPNLTFTRNYLSKDGTYLYVTTQNFRDGKNQSIQRVGLKGQKVTPVASILGIILPNTVGQCQLSYINFTAPTVVVRGPQASAAACTQSAQKYLQTYRVDTKALGLSFSAL